MMDMETRFPDFVNLCSDDEVEAKMGEEVRFDFTPNPNQGRPSFIDSNCQPEFEDNAMRQGFGEYENPYEHLIRFPVMDLEGRPMLIDSNCQPEFEDHAMRQGFEENENPYGYPINSHVRHMEGLYVNGFSYLSALPSSTSICRQFWKAGDYEGGLPRPVPQNGQNHLRVHPKFLHSNATSHKWAFGAIAELLDNAIDEVHSGASFVAIDKITNMRDGNPALLIQDDGGGMDPESLRHCMSFGFSNKQSDSSIGQYGNGFKTSTMRLGADVIVFSRCTDKRKITVSVGLLSYTFLRQTGSDDIIVPMVDYEIDPLTGSLNQLMRHDTKKFASNLSTLLRWSPFATEAELLKQFNDMGLHGTKVVVFNLWFNDDGDLELDFDSDAEDIMISGAPKIAKTKNTVKMSNQTHIATRFRYSLRVYSSILYMHLPVNFRIILRGRVVDPHYIVKDLKFVECIKYKPQVGGNIEPTVITTIGFLEGAPSINVHGFNVYHKNRLILPFWPVVSSTNGKCKGVAGVLEVNFLKPTHNKQDFERSNLFERLETRLKDMSVEYWTLHCHLVGFPAKKALPSPDLAHQIQLGTSNGIQPAIFPFQQLPHLGVHNHIRRVTENSSSFTINVSGADFSTGLSQVPAGNAHLSAGGQVVTAQSGPTCSQPRQFTNTSDGSQIGLPRKRRHENHSDVMDSLKTPEAPGEIAVGFRSSKKNQLEHKRKGYQVQRLKTMVRENTKLKTQCLEFEKAEKQLLIKVQKLRDELLEVQQYCDKLQAELKSMDEINIKVER